MRPINTENLPHRELQSSAGEIYSLSAAITETFGFKDLVVHHEILPPGRRASASHSHTLKEEMIYVIEGSPTVVLNGEAIKMNPGDSFGFKPSGKDFHTLENRTQTQVRILVISSRPPNDLAIYEPVK